MTMNQPPAEKFLSQILELIRRHPVGVALPNGQTFNSDNIDAFNSLADVMDFEEWDSNELPIVLSVQSPMQTESGYFVVQAVFVLPVDLEARSLSQTDIVRGWPAEPSRALLDQVAEFPDGFPHLCVGGAEMVRLLDAMLLDDCFEIQQLAMGEFNGEVSSFVDEDETFGVESGLPLEDLCAEITQIYEDHIGITKAIGDGAAPMFEGHAPGSRIIPLWLVSPSDWTAYVDWVSEGKVKNAESNMGDYLHRLYVVAEVAARKGHVVQFLAARVSQVKAYLMENGLPNTHESRLQALHFLGEEVEHAPVVLALGESSG